MHTAGGACLQEFGLNRCQPYAHQQSIRLCREGPGGTEDCVDDQEGMAIG